MVGLIGVGPPLPGYLTGAYGLSRRSDVRLSIRSGTAEIDHILSGLAVGASLSLLPGQSPVGGGIGRADLLRRGCCAVSGSRNGIQIQLFRRIRRRVVQVALPPLHQQDSGYSGELKRGMVAGGLHSALQPRILFLKQVADPVRLPVYSTHQSPCGTESAQHIELDRTDYPSPLLLCQRGGVGPGSILTVLFIGEAEEAHLRISRYIPQRLRRIEQGSHTRGIIICPIGSGHTVVMGGQHQDIRIGNRGRLYRGDIVPGAALAVGIGLESDAVPHFLKAVPQIPDCIGLPLGAHRPVVCGKDLKIVPELPDIGQPGGPLQHDQRLRCGDGILWGQFIPAPACHYPGLLAPEHSIPRPFRHSAGVPKTLESLDRYLGCSRLSPEDSGKFLPGDRAAWLIGSISHASEIALPCCPAHGCGILFRHIRERALLMRSGLPCRLIEQPGHRSAGQTLSRRGQKCPADRLFPSPCQRLGCPGRPRGAGSSGGREQQNTAEQQRTYSLH